MIDLTKSEKIDIMVHHGDAIDVTIEVFKDFDPSTDEDDEQYDLGQLESATMTINVGASKHLFSTTDEKLSIVGNVFRLIVPEGVSFPRLTHSYDLVGNEHDGKKITIATGFFIVL